MQRQLCGEKWNGPRREWKSILTSIRKYQPERQTTTCILYQTTFTKRLRRASLRWQCLKPPLMSDDDETLPVWDMIALLLFGLGELEIRWQYPRTRRKSMIRRARKVREIEQGWFLGSFTYQGVTRKACHLKNSKSWIWFQSSWLLVRYESVNWVGIALICTHSIMKASSSSQRTKLLTVVS
jgi:hypothetical protein